MNKIKEALIISGKGGTGKTTIVSSLSKMMKDIVIADTDVDAADMYIMLKPNILEEHSFKGRSKAEINQSLCSRCGLCMDKCRFNAIEKTGLKYNVNQYSCEGCTLCSEICPVKAIEMKEEEAGKWYLSESRYGKFIHARMNPGAENSGNLVSMVKHQSKKTAEAEGIKRILIDGPPGIGCPVTSSLSGADIVIIVTEPTASGISDMKRVIEVAMHFKPDIAVVINKSDINNALSSEIEELLRSMNIPVIAKIPFDENVVKCLNEEKTPIECTSCAHIRPELEKIKTYLEEKYEN